MTSTSLNVLGAPDLNVGGVSVAPETRKAIAVLAYVAVEGPQRRDHLDALLWPNSDGPRARAALRRTLSALRKVVPDDLLADGDDVALTRPLDTDLAEVVRLVGDDGAATGDRDRLERAAHLHRGDFLEGLWFRDADPFEHWRRNTAERCTRRHLRVLERLCRVNIDQGELGRATEVAQRRLEMDPLHEPSHQQLMLLHAWQGDRGAAARQYAACVRVLDEELGVAPLPRTMALDHAVRSGALVQPPPSTRSDRTVPSTPTAPDDVARSPSASASASAWPFVGRDAALQRLHDLHGGIGGDGAMALVTGEAGIGKSRLLAEVVRRLDGPTVHLRVRPGESRLAYAPVTEALRTLGPALQQLDDGLRAQVARLAPEAAGTDPPSEPLTSAAARTRLVQACAVALTTALTSGEGGGVLVVDDLDRADDGTRELVAYLGHRLEGCPMLVLATARDSTGLPAVDVRIELGRLDAVRVRELAAAGGAEEVADRLHTESEGVPLLVVSYLAARAGGATDWDLPLDVRDLLRRRVEQVDGVARQVLAAAAVLGGSQLPELLGRVSGRADEELVDAVETLVDAGLLVVDDHGAYAVAHDKIRRVVLEQTSHVRRRLLHRRAADALIRSTAPVPAATLAHHLEAGGLESDAAVAHAAAGRRAAGLYANEEAIDHLDLALALGHGEPAQLLLELGDLAVRTGDYSNAAQRFVRASSHGAPEAVVEHRLGALALRRGRDGEAAEHLLLALAAAPPPAQRVDVLAELAQVCLQRGDLDVADAHAQDAVAIAEGPAGTSGAAARAHNAAGLVARRRGDLSGAHRHLRSSLELAVGIEQRAAALNNLALVLAEEGALDEAVVIARDALDAGRVVADRHREAALLNNLADLLHADGRTDEALRLQTEVAALFASLGEAATTTPEIWRLVDW